MRGTIIALCLLICVLVLIGEPVSAVERSALLQSCSRYGRQLQAVDVSPEQRTILTVALAGAETGVTNPVELLEAYQQSSGLVTELLQSDTSSGWDVDTWLDQSRSTYSYDGSNRLTMSVAEYFDGTDWWDYLQILYAYDVSSRIQAVTTKTAVGKIWVNQSLTTYSGYNVSGGPGTVLMQQWTGGVWKDTMRTTFTYVSGHTSTSVSEAWTGSAWVNTNKNSYTYNGSGKLTEQIIQVWQSGVWSNVSRITSTYNGSGDVVQNTTQSWQTGAWVNLTLDEFTYNASHLPILSVRSMWASVLWMAMYNDTMKYSGDRLIEKVSLSILGGALSREQYTYNVNGNEVLELAQDWDMIGSAWVNTFRTISVYGSGLSCCTGTTGNVNMAGIVDLSDLTWLIDYLTVIPRRVLPCPEEANVNGLGIIDLSDLTILIDYLTVVPQRTLPTCP